MTRTAHSRRSPSCLRTELTARLEARRNEIEQAILTRVYSVSDPTLAGDPEYVAGLRAAVAAAIDYGIADIGQGTIRPAPIPDALLAQARQAARHGVGMDTVLRRYFAGYTLLVDFVMQEAEESTLFAVEELQALGKSQAIVFDRLVDAIAEEYKREVDTEIPLLGGRRAECIERLLAGEFADSSEIEYEIDAWHIGGIARGVGVERALRDLAQALDRRLLLLPRGEGTAWAWFGGRSRVEFNVLDHAVAEKWSAATFLVVGEPGYGLTGWRHSHRQAAAILPVALRMSRPLTRYAEVALLASILQDEVLTTSLRDFYLAPLADERDGGAPLRQTLRAYFAAERNVSSTASALGVSRKTVTNRLRTIEQRIGRPLHGCAAELEVALRLEEFAGP
jgi:hypothetical protein